MFCSKPNHCIVSDWAPLQHILQFNTWDLFILLHLDIFLTDFISVSFFWFLLSVLLKKSTIFTFKKFLFHSLAQIINQICSPVVARCHSIQCMLFVVFPGGSLLCLINSHFLILYLWSVMRFMPPLKFKVQKRQDKTLRLRGGESSTWKSLKCLSSTRNLFSLCEVRGTSKHDLHVFAIDLCRNTYDHLACLIFELV